MNKYRNIKVKYNGSTFDSKKEYYRYLELKQKEKLGIIKDLQKQVRFELQPSFKFRGKTIRKIEYIADFVYYENDIQIIEDVKSEITRKDKVYVLKKKLMNYRGFDIREI